MTNHQRNKLINAIATGNLKGMQGQGLQYNVETWKLEDDCFTNGIENFTEAGFSKYRENNKRSKLILLSVNNLSEHQIEILKHETQ